MTRIARVDETTARIKILSDSSFILLKLQYGNLNKDHMYKKIKH